MNDLSNTVCGSQTCNPSELAGIFLRLGTTAFGGPAAHIAMMRAEFVDRRAWISEAEFLDLVGASNLLPGPSSTEVAIFIGYRLAGWTGLVLAGTCFILPAMVIVSALAWGYLRYGHLPQSAALFYGIKPVVIAVIGQAVWSLARTSFKRWQSMAASSLVLVGSFLGMLPLPLLFVSGISLAAREWYGNDGKKLIPDRAMLTSIAAIFGFPLFVTTIGPFLPTNITLTTLFLTFVRIGSMVFGSGYVLLDFLRNELITRLHWLNSGQLLDSIAVGQLTPGPVFTSATFIGYILRGPVGAVVATAGIFLPAFVSVGAAGNLVKRIRSSTITGAFLDGINAAAIGLMAYADFLLGQAALIDLSSTMIMLASLLLLVKFKTNSAFLVLGGAALGLLLRR